MSDITIDNVEPSLAKSFGASNWIEVGQFRIDQFAESTGDRQWIHIDVERAQRQSRSRRRSRTDISAHPLLPRLQWIWGLPPKDVLVVISYGLDRVRFIKRVSGFV
jgi:acyl dehydratase